MEHGIYILNATELRQIYVTALQRGAFATADRLAKQLAKMSQLPDILNNQAA
jgi:hypothetical protein